MDKEFKPRVFRSKINQWGLDDGGVASFTFKVQSLKKGKLYYEKNPRYIEGHSLGVVIDDNSCWHHVKDKNFNELFEEIK